MSTTSKTTTAAPEQLGSKLAYLTRVLKTPTIGRTWADLGELARSQNWSHEEYLAAVLERQVADRESAGAIMRIRTAHFPAVKTLEDFNLEHLPSLRKDLLAHLATVTFVPKAANVVLLGPPGIGKTHCETPGWGLTGLDGAGVSVSVLVIATDPKDSLTRPVGGVLAVDLSSWSPAPAWPTIVGLIRSLADPVRVVPHHSPAAR